MSDENMNNTEETSALFVSSQKKKQAEEEARRKAEEEQAKREAAEAEVRRMEAEVEERKKKVEEEKRALEEAAKQPDTVKASAAAKPEAKAQAKTEGKSKPPIAVIIGAAAAVVLILIIVFAFMGKEEPVDYAAMEFATEYSVADENVAMTILYPESLYTGMTESYDPDDGSVTIDSQSEKSKSPGMRVVVIPFPMESTDVQLLPAKMIQTTLEEAVQKTIASLNISEEHKSDLAAETPGKYYVDCTGTTEGGLIYAVSSWLEKDDNGKLCTVVGLFSEEGEDPTNVNNMRDRYEEANSAEALVIPGGNPPAMDETDGMLEIDAMHMGIIVPKDQFHKTSVETDNAIWWIDDNGAYYAITFTEVPYDFDTAHEHAAEVEAGMEPLIEEVAGLKRSLDFDSRMAIEDEWISDFTYRGEYKDIVGGITYWEGNWSTMWRDVRTQKYYVYDLVLMAPYVNAESYKTLFYKGIDRLQDI